LIAAQDALSTSPRIRAVLTGFAPENTNGPFGKSKGAAFLIHADVID
jgi:hypothetical protein